MNYGNSLKKISGVLWILLGVLLLAINISFIFRVLGVILLLISFPNLMASSNRLNEKNPFITVVFIKSLLLVIVSIFLLIYPTKTGIFGIIAGVILSIGTIIENLIYDKNHKLTKKEIYTLIFAAMLIIFGGTSFVTLVLEVTKYVLGGISILYGIVILVTTKSEKVDFEAQLREYEERYQQSQNAENKDVIEGTYEENSDIEK